MNQLLSEFPGVFTPVFAGTGAIGTNDVSGGVIGHAVIALEAMLAGPICGASMNPARQNDETRMMDAE